MQEKVPDYVYQISGLDTLDRKYLCACVCVAPTAILLTHSRLKLFSNTTNNKPMFRSSIFGDLLQTQEHIWPTMIIKGDPPPSRHPPSRGAELTVFRNYAALTNGLNFPHLPDVVVTTVCPRSARFIFCVFPPLLPPLFFSCPRRKVNYTN